MAAKDCTAWLDSTSGSSGPASRAIAHKHTHTGSSGAWTSVLLRPCSSPTCLPQSAPCACVRVRVSPPSSAPISPSSQSTPTPTPIHQRCAPDHRSAYATHNATLDTYAILDQLAQPTISLEGRGGEGGVHSHAGPSHQSRLRGLHTGITARCTAPHAVVPHSKLVPFPVPLVQGSPISETIA